MKSRDAKRRPVVKAMSEVPGVTEIYTLQRLKNSWFYKRVFSAIQKQPRKFQKWANAHSREILDATATQSSPDLIGLLADETGFDLIGDHGGAQEAVQGIPLMIFNSKNQGKTVREPIRMFEVKDKILSEFGINPVMTLEGQISP